MESTPQKKGLQMYLYLRTPRDDVQTKRPRVCLCSFKMYGRRGQNLTMLVGDVDLYLNLNQPFSIFSTCHFFFLNKLWYEQNIAGFPLSHTVLGQNVIWQKMMEENFGHTLRLFYYKLFISLWYWNVSFQNQQHFYYACFFIHCIQIICWLLSIDFYIVLKILCFSWVLISMTYFLLNI